MATTLAPDELQKKRQMYQQKIEPIRASVLYRNVGRNTMSLEISKKLTNP